MKAMDPFYNAIARRDFLLPIYVLEKDNSHPGDVTREQINLTFGGRAIQTTDPADIPWHDLAGSAALYVFEKENSIIQPDGSVWNWITPEREQALWNYINEGGHSAEGGTSIAGWCRQIGKGRVASLTPGHTFDIVRQKELIRLVRNAASWVTGETFSTDDL